ncbi:MAG: DNA polymerase III subunit alpha [Chloroflexota bacterium]|nr:DNA polymerase III subunit alpha [Chloroflexota bacterium]
MRQHLGPFPLMRYNDGMSANSPPPSPITHLHVHSQYSLLGSTASVESLVQRAVADGLSHLALTDTNSLVGTVAFNKACQQADIQPITGLLLSLAPLPGLLPVDELGPDLLVLLATGPAGFRSLCRLSTAIQGHPDRLDRARHGLGWDTLKDWRDGLICIAGGRRSWIERSLRLGNRQAAVAILGRLAGLFDDRLYLALENHGRESLPVNQEMVELANRFGIATVAVQPVYTLSRRETPRLRLLAAIDHNLQLKDVPPAVLPNLGDGQIDLHWLSPAEMTERFEAFPEALTTTMHVAHQCQPALPDGSPIWPALKLPPGKTSRAALRDLASEGLIRHYGPNPAGDIQERLTRELDSIDHHGYAPLFLLVADVVRFARSQDIPVSTRGSVANSLVAFCTGISTVDPVAHNLLFERFLSPARLDPPDIDLDFCSRRRDQVLEYVRETYDLPATNTTPGEERVALVGTISTMRLKSAIRETAKAYGLDDHLTGQVIRLLPGRRHPDPRRRSKKSAEEVLAEAQKLTNDPGMSEKLRQVVTNAYALEGQPHHLSVHPGGIVITPGPLADTVPVQWTAKGFLITQFDHRDVEAIGLPKIDLLGIRALTVLADTVELVQRDVDPNFRLADIPLDDPSTAAMLEAGNTIGVFQCDSSGAQRTLRQLRARTLADLAVANAFFKPGPAAGGMAQVFIQRYRGEAPVEYLHPTLEPILGNTKGVLIFQEQILRVATEIAGLDWQQADRLRRGMSKFQPEEMKKTQDVFIRGCQESGFSEQQANRLWDQIIPFAGYGFNQGHATAYADVSYRSAYLKTHYPAQFLCARLAERGGFHHPAVYMAEARQLGIDVWPPHVNQSGREFTLAFEASSDREAQPVLWMGLGQVRDLRRATVSAIVKTGRAGKFGSLRDLLQRVCFQEKEITHLIQCGALDGLASSRNGLLAELREIRRAGSATQLAFDFPTPDVPTESAQQQFDWEKHLLGDPIGVNPLDLVTDLPADSTPLDMLRGHAGHRITAAGYRIPGWTGGQGFFLSNGNRYVLAMPPKGIDNPRPWQPLLVTGRWMRDQWDSEWLQVSSWQVLG